MVTGLAVSLVLLCLVVLTASAASAQSRPDIAPPAAESAQGQKNIPKTLAQLPRGEQIPDGAALLFQTTEGPVAAPLQSTTVRLKVTGHTVRAEVSQTYRNPSDQWLDASYRFPLPADSAVDTMRMRIGDQLIKGVIQERQQATRNYETARREGKRASLVLQRKPNDFTAQVANISPRGDITIEIEYQQVLAMTPNGWSLRFPTVVAPRYRPFDDLVVPEQSAIRFNPRDVRDVRHGGMAQQMTGRETETEAATDGRITRFTC